MIPQVVAEDLKRDEGWVPHAYQDHLGYWTIGYGFLIDERKGGRLPKHIGNQWLQWEIEQRWRELTDAEPWLDDQPEDVQRALANMAYQLGVSGVLRFRKMLAALRSGDREKAAEEMINSKWHAQTPERCERLAKLVREAGSA